MQRATASELQHGCSSSEPPPPPSLYLFSCRPAIIRSGPPAGGPGGASGEEEKGGGRGAALGLHHPNNGMGLDALETAPKAWPHQEKSPKGGLQSGDRWRERVSAKRRAVTQTAINRQF